MARSEATFIHKKQRFVMWIAGLRGAMAYALAMQSIADYGNSGKIMLAITLIYSLVTILGIGSILNPILTKCEVRRKPGADQPEPEEVNPVTNPDNQDNTGERKRCCQDFKRLVSYLNQHYFSPVFIKE
jgi:NhaP-type Na+/H+ or K+/H+ antiporter